MVRSREAARAAALLVNQLHYVDGSLNPGATCPSEDAMIGSAIASKVEQLKAYGVMAEETRGRGEGAIVRGAECPRLLFSLSMLVGCHPYICLTN